jgi:hypothetical protein
MTWCDSRVLNRWPGDKHGGTKHIRHGHYDKHSGAQSQKTDVLYEKKQYSAGEQTENHDFVKPILSDNLPPSQEPMDPNQKRP